MQRRKSDPSNEAHHPGDTTPPDSFNKATFGSGVSSVLESFVLAPSSFENRATASRSVEDEETQELDLEAGVSIISSSEEWVASDNNITHDTRPDGLRRRISMGTPSSTAFSPIGSGDSRSPKRRGRPVVAAQKFRKKVVKISAESSKRGVRAAGSILQDFRHFILRGGVIDVCIGFIIGGAFTTIMTSFTQDIIGPVVGLALGSNLQNAFVMLRYPDCAGQNGTDCSSLKTPSQVYAAGGVTWNYGNFFQTLFNFLLTAWILFFMVKVYSAASKQFTDHKSKKDLERLCPYCLKKVPLLATRCYQCTSDLPPLDFPSTSKAALGSNRTLKSASCSKS